MLSRLNVNSADLSIGEKTPEDDNEPKQRETTAKDEPSKANFIILARVVLMLGKYPSLPCKHSHFKFLPANILKCAY